jgi:hypothetical protein
MRNRNSKANIARHKSSIGQQALQIGGERNQATHKINQHRDDQDRTSVDCQDVVFEFAQNDGHNAQFEQIAPGLTASYNPHFDQVHLLGDNRVEHP